MSEREFTLDDLVRETGFSKRQIRFYITRKLVPGAGESRGPHATYSEETLERLFLIRDLKDRPMGPTGRTMTLDEIGHALDELTGGPREGSREILLGGPMLSIEDEPPARKDVSVQQRSSGAPSFKSSARDYLQAMRESFSAHGEIVREQTRDSMLASFCARAFDDRDETDHDLGDLLGRLQALLAELGSDTRFTTTARGAGQWLRVTTPDVEFHVRKPDDHGARIRLGMMAKALARLLEREE